MSELVLPVKGIYFDEIRSGAKTREFRLTTEYWAKRLIGRQYDRVTITRGYPARGDADRRMTFPWHGYERTTITHPFFGDAPVEVFAIVVGRPQTLKA